MRRALLLLLALCPSCDETAPALAPVPEQPAIPPEVAQIQAALPDYVAALVQQPSAPRHKQIRNLIAAGQAEQAEQAIDALVALLAKGPDGEASFLMGWTLFGQTRYAQALPHLQACVRAGPGYPQAERAFFLLGRCFQERGDLQAARAAFEADIRLLPDQGQGHFRLAQLELESGDLKACERRARAALERFTRLRDKAKTHALLANVFEARGDLPRARTELERCVELFPHYEALYKLSRICERLGDQAAAERYLEEHQLWRTRAGR